jgi:DNA repair protein RadA/Sms
MSNVDVNERWTPIRADAIKTREVEWLWPEFIAYGKVTVLEGDGGVGKSYLCIQLMADLSLGKSPGGCVQVAGATKRNSLYITYEDQADDTLVPRLIKSKGDRSKVFVVEFPGDIGTGEGLEHAVRESHAKLVVIDVLSAAVGDKRDWHKDTDMRAILTPLARIAAKHSCAIVVVRHLNKNGRERFHRGSGSVAIQAAGRSAVRLERGAAQGEVVVSSIKTNNGATPQPSSFRIDDDGVFQWVPYQRPAPTEAPAKRDRPSDIAERMILTSLSTQPAGMPAKDLMALVVAAGCSESTFNRVAGSMTRDGRLIRTQSGGAHWVRLAGLETSNSNAACPPTYM